ncbi:MAG: 7-dehydrocholesterol reductase [Proteobacteria bacterium]|nr:7-dehydrocholesterol reductase [Pseudomonadota bacterium]
MGDWAEAKPGGQFGTAFRAWVWPLVLIVACPILAIWFWIVAVHHDGSVLAYAQSGEWFAHLPLPSGIAALIIVVWCAVQYVLLRIVPGKEYLGPPTPAGEQPRYKLNGVACYVITLGLTAGFGWYAPTLVYNHFGEILITSSLLSLVGCGLLVLKGTKWPTTADASRSDNLIWDFWNGVELHPRLLGVELKQWINCRVSMAGWAAILVLYAAAQIERTGNLDPAMAACVGLHCIYLFKFFWWEDGYFGSLDITHDRFGFYLFWGLMVWVPSLYCLVGLYLVDHTGHLDWPLAGAITAFGIASIWANYDADRQRMRVRRTGGDTTVWGKKPEVIEATYQTADGEERTNLLLVSGWWGTARHLHYVFELALATAWTLPALFTHLLPWSYVIFLAILLTDRARRDERRCAAKYGPAWDEYRSRVKWRMVPGIY